MSETVVPANSFNKRVVWSSDNDSIATVSYGTITATGIGTTTITVTTEDGGFTSTCEVTVIDSHRIQLKSSSDYTIDNNANLLKNIPLNSSVTQLKQNLANDAENIKVYTKEGSEYTGDHLATGMIVKLIVGGTIKDELTTIVLGDTSGDGNISITDYTLLKT